MVLELETLQESGISFLGIDQDLIKLVKVDLIISLLVITLDM